MTILHAGLLENMDYCYKYDEFKIIKELLEIKLN